MYGLAATQLIRHREIVGTPRGDVTIYFLLPEDKGSSYWGLHPTTLIYVGSRRVTAFLGDDINGNEMQRAILNDPFFNDPLPPSSLLVIPASSPASAKRKGNRGDAKKLSDTANILFIHDGCDH